MNNEDAHCYTHLCACESGVIYISGQFCDSSCDVDFDVPIILGRKFLATRRALVDMEKAQMKFKLNNEQATLNICRSMK